MSPSRWTVLTTVLSLASFGIAGCASNSNNETPTTSDSDDEMPTTIKFWLKEATVSEQKRDDLNPITCANVTDGEREIIQTTIERGEYTSEIGSESPALETLRERIGDQNPGGLEVFLKCDDTYYRVGFVDGNHIMATV